MNVQISAYLGCGVTHLPIFILKRFGIWNWSIYGSKTRTKFYEILPRAIFMQKKSQNGAGSCNESPVLYFSHLQHSWCPLKLLSCIWCLRQRTNWNFESFLVKSELIAVFNVLSGMCDHKGLSPGERFYRKPLQLQITDDLGPLPTLIGLYLINVELSLFEIFLDLLSGQSSVIKVNDKSELKNKLGWLHLLLNRLLPPRINLWSLVHRYFPEI